MAINLDFDNKILFNKLNTYFNDNINLSLKTQNNIFIITKADVFYGINIYDESFPSFILSNENSILESMIVRQLSGKNITDLSYGFCHYVARNNKNEIFCWGNNCCGQIGNGQMDEESISMDFIKALRDSNENCIFSRICGKQQNKPEVNKFLSNLNIDVVKCGFWHSLALTKNGEVYAWGLISTGGSLKEMCQSTPVKVDGFDGEKVIMISCGYKHSMALTESGRVFSWGENSYGQLGNGNEIYREKPKLIEFRNVSFKKISCGQRHSLLLSNDGVIYAFGDNRCGQIGNGNQEMQSKPIPLTHDKRFTDIASNFMEDISISLSTENKIYVWGKCGNEIHSTSTLTSFVSFDEIFSNLTCIQYEPSKKLTAFNDLLFRCGYYKREFKELEIIGQGSYGKVYRVKDKNGNLFAVKKLKSMPESEKEFLREYINQTHVNSLNSDFLAKQYDSWFENKRKDNESKLSLYIKMELCDKTLLEVMNEIHNEFYIEGENILSPIGYYLASEIFIDLLRAVLCLHQNKIIHRDLNPSNILLKKEENGDISVKIADFGLSVLHEFSEQSHSKDKGTPLYMAPEVLNKKNYDTKADIHSLGIIFENLFKIDITKEYKADSGENSILSKKYDQSLEFFSLMTNRVPAKRPYCETILEKQELWALNENEFRIENGLNSLFEFGFKGKNFLIHSILESKFISLKAKKMAISESSALQTLNEFEHKPDFIQKYLVHLKNHWINDFDLRTNLIDSIVNLMRKYSNLVEVLKLVLINSITCLYSLIENDSIEKINPKLLKNNKKEKISLKELEKVVEVTLIAMELFPNDEELQKSALIILYSEQVLQNLSSEKYKCCKLVMDSMINFKKIDMNLMASVICSTNLMEMSIKERTNLGSNYVYIKILLDVINSRVEVMNYDLIENTLSALVNLLVDSPRNCSIFLEQGGLNVSFNLLNTFNSCNDIEFIVLGLLYNIAEFAEFKNKFLESKFISKLRNLMHSLKINVSFFAAGIFAQLLHDGRNAFSDSEIILEELMNVILNWKTVNQCIVSFVSFSTFQPLLASFASPAVQFWAIWTIHHFCSKNPEKYCEMLLKEIKIESLKALLRNSNQCEPLIAICRKTVNIFERSSNN